MARKIFINLAVRDLPKSIAFFKALGFSFNAQFCDDNSNCMIISDDISVMLLTHAKFNELTPKAIADPARQCEVLTTIALETRAEVDAIADAAITAGGREAHPPEDHGFMYHRAFEDLDGHGWGLIWMNPAHVHPT